MKIKRTLAITALNLLAFFSKGVTSPVIKAEPTAITDKKSADISFETIDGDTTSLADFQGNVVLLVNTASECGFTPQYEELEKIYRKYKDRGFTVLAFPANNFMNQEPGTNAQICKFVESKFDVTFPMMSKISVKGDDIHPLYDYLTAESPVPGEIEWNFTKFLIDRAGNVVARYSSKIEPTDEEVVSEIEKNL